MAEGGERCQRDTGDSSRLCEAHRRAMQSVLQADLLHCHDCFLLVRAPSGAIDAAASLARCPVAFSYAERGQPTGNSPCYYEVADVFAPLGERGEIAEVMEQTVRAEERLVRRQTRLSAKLGGALTNELLRATDQHIRHLRELAEFKGVYTPVKASVSVPVPAGPERNALVDALLHAGEPVEHELPKPRGMEVVPEESADSGAPPRS